MIASLPTRSPASRSWLRRYGRAATLVLMLIAPVACGPKISRPPSAGQAQATAPSEPQTAAPGSTLPSVSPQPVPDVPTRVGLLLPLSGPNAALGRAMLQAAELALFEVGGEDVGLIVRDTEAAPGGATQAAQEVAASGVRIILGPVFSASVAASAPVARGAGISLVSFSTDRAVAGDGVFVMGILPSLQVDRVVGYASRQGLHRFAALAPSTPYGTTVAAALNAATTRFGGSVVTVVYYDPAAPDVSKTVRELAPYRAPTGAGFEAVLLAEGGVRLRSIAPLLPYYDVDPDKVRFLGTALWDDPKTGSEPALVGGWFASPSPEQWNAFATKYAATYGEAPPRLASLAYDGMALAAALSRSGDFSREALTRPSGFSGVDGIFRFLPDGSVERGLAMFQVQPGGAKLIEPAAQSFDEVIY